jgi:hypothetical protein
MGISLLPSIAIAMATILAWPQIANTQLAQQLLGSFEGFDLDTGLAMRLYNSMVSREDYNYTLGGLDDGFSAMPEPGQPERADSISLLAHEPAEYESHAREEPSKPSPLPEGEWKMLPGHRYLIDGKDNFDDGWVMEWQCFVGKEEDVVVEELIVVEGLFMVDGRIMSSI